MKQKRKLIDDSFLPHTIQRYISWAKDKTWPCDGKIRSPIWWWSLSSPSAVSPWCSPASPSKPNRQHGQLAGATFGLAHPSGGAEPGRAFVTPWGMGSSSASPWSTSMWLSARTSSPASASSAPWSAIGVCSRTTGLDSTLKVAADQPRKGVVGLHFYCFASLTVPYTGGVILSPDFSTARQKSMIGTA